MSHAHKLQQTFGGGETFLMCSHCGHDDITGELDWDATECRRGSRSVSCWETMEREEARVEFKRIRAKALALKPAMTTTVFTSWCRDFGGQPQLVTPKQWVAAAWEVLDLIEDELADDGM